MNHETLSLEKIKNKKELPKAVNDVEQLDSEQKDDSFDLGPLRLEAKRFDEKLASMVSHLKELKDHERRSAASNYRHSLEKFESDTRHELTLVRQELAHYAWMRVGEFVDSFKYEFDGTSKEESVKQAIDRMREENIPAVNIPIIINLLARAGLLEHKLSLVRETKALVEGYDTISSQEYKKEDAIKAKRDLSKLISLLDHRELGPFDKENDLEFSLLNSLGEMLAKLGISISYLSKAREFIKSSNRKEAKDVLTELDDKLNEIINV